MPDDMPPAQLDALAARWPNGRWFDIESALGAGLPAPLRKLLLAG